MRMVPDEDHTFDPFVLDFGRRGLRAPLAVLRNFPANASKLARRSPSRTRRLFQMVRTASKACCSLSSRCLAKVTILRTRRRARLLPI